MKKLMFTLALVALSGSSLFGLDYNIITDPAVGAPLVLSQQIPEGIEREVEGSFKNQRCQCPYSYAPIYGPTREDGEPCQCVWIGVATDIRYQ